MTDHGTTRAHEYHLLGARAKAEHVKVIAEQLMAYPVLRCADKGPPHPASRPLDGAASRRSASGETPCGRGCSEASCASTALHDDVDGWPEVLVARTWRELLGGGRVDA